MVQLPVAFYQYMARTCNLIINFSDQFITVSYCLHIANMLNDLITKYARLKSNVMWRVYGIQYIPRNMHTVFALLCFVVVIHWLIFPYPSGLLHWHCGNLTIAPVPGKQPWWIWINTSCEFIMNDCITTTKQNTTKPCAYFLGYTVPETCCDTVPTKLPQPILIHYCEVIMGAMASEITSFTIVYSIV